MKGIFTIVLGLSSLLATAQEFESAEDALGYLDEVLRTVATKKEGKYWIDPVLPEVSGEGMYFHNYTGKISKDEDGSFSPDELSGLETASIYIETIAWEDIKSISLKKGWLTITGNFKDDEGNTTAKSHTYYVEDEPENIKAALEYARTHREE